MSLKSRLFGSGYDDKKLQSVAQTAVLEDPTIPASDQVVVACEHGVITLTGRVQKSIEKDHLEGAVRDALRYRGLKFERIANEVTVGVVKSVAQT